MPQAFITLSYYRPYQKLDHKEWCLFPNKKEDNASETDSSEDVDSNEEEPVVFDVGTEDVFEDGFEEGVLEEVEEKVRSARSGFFPLFESLRMADGSWR